MNLVRLGMIVALGGIAAYAIYVYAGLPKETISVAAMTVQQNVTYTCPAISNSWSGLGMVFVAIAAIAGAMVVSAVDLARRVY